MARASSGSTVTTDQIRDRIRRRRPSLTTRLRPSRGLVVVVTSIAATLAVWEWYGRGVDPIFFSYPSAIAAAIPSMWSTGELPTALIQSAVPFAIGWSLAIAAGVMLGLVTGRYRLADLALSPQLTALYNTPNVALIPLFILWFGLGNGSKVAIVFLSAFFPVYVNTHGGIRTISRSLVDIARVEGASEIQVLTKIGLPGAVPFIMTGVRLSVGRAVVGIIIAEMFTAITGLGGRIITYGNEFQTDRLLAIVIIVAVLGVLLTQAVNAIEARVAPWKQSERAS